MISFRFHLVSLAAIFMALALGIVLGTAFLNDQTVSTLNARIDKVKKDANDSRSALSVWTKFGSDAETALISGRLAGVRVLTIVPEGLSGSVTDKVQSLLSASGAIDAGTVTVANTWADTPPPTADIAKTLDIVGPSSIQSVTAAAADRLAHEFAAGSGPTLPALVDANLVRLDAGDPATTPGGPSRFLVIDDGPGTGLLEPLARALATVIPKSVLVADAGPDDSISQSLVGAMRHSPQSALFSTVDHLRTVPGQVAAILALRDFDQGATGDYGSCCGAGRAAPAAG